MPDILINSSSYWHLHKNKIKISHSLFSINTQLGWTMSDNSHSSAKPYASAMKVECSNLNLLHERYECIGNNESSICTAKDLQNLWSLDVLGINNN